MTNRAVVVELRPVVDRMIEGSAPESERLETWRPWHSRDHVLMFVVRKNDGELNRGIRLSKSKSNFVAWRNLRVAYGTNRWPVSPEELWSMATDTCGMIRVVSYIGMRLCFLPTLAWNLMARAALCLMFLRCVRELGIVDCGRTSLRTRWSTSPLRVYGDRGQQRNARRESHCLDESKTRLH
jgi:hypothetical protein